MINIRKQAGFAVTAEMVFLATIIFIGSIIGLVVIRDALVQELLDVAEAIEISEQYAFDGIKKTVQESQSTVVIVNPELEGIQ
ncbi:MULTISPECIES: hypothetical protein [unclassified Colwellia]|uniref:hypothetical protein n=1 Tax=unclassified Colwellia TaxID=196834 RepID=UPI0015F3BB8F|nr:MULTISPECIES: hypothetical protein [unclassified Colwellia]MBA6350292.1 hypothetical protein [Colwellia sp. BRX8-9]MBA6383668.1 hypothetical protein [Colwellia sp. BRX10-9]MBA6394378.1 hypothetical protein [Colwellia sp. BRX10-6]